MADPLKEIDSAAKSQDAKVQYWQGELELAKKRREKFCKKGDQVVRLYEGDIAVENSFNILYSNTETLLPACYNQLPRPFVDRRFKDADPLGKQAALSMERVLSALEDTGDVEYDSFGALMEQAVLGALVPGEGLTWFRYDAEITRAEGALGDADKSGEDAEAAGSSDEGDESGQEGEGTELLAVPSQEKVAYETVCGHDIDYDEVLYGYGRRWVDVPWIARLHYMTKEDVEKNFGKKVAEELAYNKEEPRGWKDNEEGGTTLEAERGTQAIVYVWEIWNKQKREVLFYAPSYTDALLKELPDPYGLSGFFPCPEPLKMLLKRSKLTGTAPYVLYEEQAKELNRITRRINRVIEALKVRGFYDNTMQGLDDLLEKGDNTFIPARNVSSMQPGQNLSNSLFMMPLKELQTVLHELISSREAIKQTIYEITGIADIMRGNSVASETATAQNIKNQWGTLKLKRMQRYVQEYVRSCLRIVGELAGQHFSIETIAQITGLPYATPEEVQKAQQVIQLVQKAAMQVPLQQNPQTGQMMPGPLPPQVMQAAQQAQASLAKPRWADVVGLLRNDLLRNYRIDIETNSTIAADTMEDKNDVNEAMTSLAQMFQGFVPVVQQGMMPLSVLKSMTLSVARRFAFGREVEDAIAMMPEQMPQQGPDPKQVQDGLKQVQDGLQKVEQGKQEIEGERKELDMDWQAAMNELDLKLKSTEERMALAHERNMLAVQSMMEGYMQQVGQTVTDAETKRLQSDTKLKAEVPSATKGLQQTNILVAKTMEALLRAVEALTKAASAERQVVLQSNAQGRPISAISRPVSLN